MAAEPCFSEKSTLADDSVSFALTLRPGLCWHICAADSTAATVVTQMAAVMELPPSESINPPATGTSAKRIVVVSNGGGPAEVSPEDAIFQLPPGQPGRQSLLSGQVRASMALARALLPQGGLLLHGALAERMGRGTLFVGSSSAGKSTASRRLPPPWRSLCDDTTLVMPDAQGQWWAHPWPTWSLCIEGGPGGTWNVQSAVPLGAIFFLQQDPMDSVKPLGTGRASARLAQAAEEVSPLAWSDAPPDQIRQLRVQRFDWLSELARTVPAFTLELSLAGAFWQKIEETLGWDTRRA